MTSSEMNKLANLYSEIDLRLERGEAENPELESLFLEVSTLLQASEEVWFHFDHMGDTQLVVHFGPTHVWDPNVS
jgi:hypothetical protein